MALNYGLDGQKITIVTEGGGSLSGKGFSMAGYIFMDGNKITGLPEPTTSSEPVTKSYADANYSGTAGVSSAGFSMRGNIDMNHHKLLNVATPALDDDAVK